MQPSVVLAVGALDLNFDYSDRSQHSVAASLFPFVLKGFLPAHLIFPDLVPETTTLDQARHAWVWAQAEDA